MSTTIEPEFDRWIGLNEIPGKGVTRRLEASPAERAALARRYGVKAVRGLTAEVTLRPLAPGRWRLEGRFEATLVQTCVVTLEDIETRAADSFSVMFEAGAAAPAGTEVEIDALADDPPEPVVDGRIPLGETVAQYVALAIDPYPRDREAAMEQTEAGPEDAAEPQSPFAILRKLG